MLIIPIIGCKDDDDDDAGKGNLVNAEYDENGLKMDSLPADLNYLGRKINVLHWNNPGHQEFDVESVTGNNVLDAIYERNTAIQDRLNVEINFIGEPGGLNDRASFVKRVQMTMENNTHDFDIITSYSRTEGMLGVQGLLKDVNNLGKDVHSYLSYGQPWWPADMIESLSFGDSCFFLSGDISTNVLYNMTCIFFNKSQLKARFNAEAQAKGFEGEAAAVDWLYDMVYSTNAKYTKKYENEKWTLDKLIKISQDYCDGVDNSPYTANRKEGKYGFVSVYFQMDGLYTGSNLHLVDQDPNDLLIISPDFGSAKTVALVRKLGEWVKNSNVCLVEKVNGELESETTGGASVPGHQIPFMKGRALFLLCRAEVAESSISKQTALVKGGYGVLPCPKYNDKQLNYYTCLGNPISIYGIFVDSYDPGNSDGISEAEHYSMLTAVLECWASEAYRRTMPEIFYVNMMVKYSDSPKEADMYQYVRNGIVFDLGRVFSEDLSFMSEMPSRVAANSASWSTAYGAYKRQLDKKMEAIVESFRDQGVIG